MLLVWLAYQIDAIFMFYRQDAKLSPLEPPMIDWIESFEKGCDKDFPINKGLHYSCFNACSYTTFFAFAYFGAMNRLGCTTFIAENAKGFCQIVTRLFVIALMGGIALLPLLLKLISVDKVGDVGYMWLAYLIPIGFMGWFTTSGAYDYFISLLECREISEK